MPQDDFIDPEAIAVSKVVSALSALDPAAQKRVLRYASERFSIALSPTTKAVDPAIQASTTTTPTLSGGFADIGALMEQAQPKSGLMRALVAGYWFQFCQNLPKFTGQEVNDQLKSLGHASSNITSDMTKLIRRKPSLIQQVGKSGKAQQARKDYRLTTAGQKAVTELISGASSENGE